jgi:MFS family permease
MTPQERRGWKVIASVALTNFIVMGPSIGTIGIFFTPLIKDFGWTREEVSRLATAFLFAMGIINPVVGWLLDRVEARVVMTIGAAAAGVGYVLCSRADSLTAMVVLFTLIGLGVGASTILPGIIVAANWFSRQRALATGITIAGAGFGGCVLPPLVAHLILVYGWRPTMLCIAAPMFVVAIPVVILSIRTRPEAAEGKTAAEEAASLPGLELGPALRCAPFWILAAMQFSFTVAFTGGYFHMVPFLIGAGYTPQTAAFVFGAQAAVSLPGYVLLGTLADRFGAKTVLTPALIMLALSMIILLGTGGHRFGLPLAVLFIVTYGLTVGSATTLGAVLLAEACGLRRFGTLNGIIGFIAVVGSAIGPLASGRIFDLTASYTVAFELCAGLLLAAAILTTLVYPAEGRDAAPVHARAQ